MATLESRSYSVADFVEWNEKGLLNLSPDFQRRSVWSEKAKSYLIDTIVRGKPIPKIIVQTKLQGKRQSRIVIDGQQRLRAILGFIDGDFSISSAHNKELARKNFDVLPRNLQNTILSYSISADIIGELPYDEILDIFIRINTYTVPLSNQELLNAKYVGYFKQTAFSMGLKYVTYFLDGKILDKNDVNRMEEAELASDLIISLIDGIQSNKILEQYYREYEDDEDNLVEICGQFHRVMATIGGIYSPTEISQTSWRRLPLFYSLFTSVAHGLYGLPNLQNVPRPKLKKTDLSKVRNCLDELAIKIEEYIRVSDVKKIPRSFRHFIDVSRRRTADARSRTDRASFICREIDVA